MSKNISRRGLLGGMLGALAGLLHGPPQAPPPAPASAPAAPPPTPALASIVTDRFTYDSGGYLTTFDDGLTLRVECRAAGSLDSLPPVDPGWTWSADGHILGPSAGKQQRPDETGERRGA